MLIHDYAKLSTAETLFLSSREVRVRRQFLFTL